MAAIVVSFAVYMALAYWTSVVATPAELVTDFTIVVQKTAAAKLIVSMPLRTSHRQSPSFVATPMWRN